MIPFKTLFDTIHAQNWTVFVFESGNPGLCEIEERSEGRGWEQMLKISFLAEFQTLSACTSSDVAAVADSSDAY